MSHHVPGRQEIEGKCWHAAGETTLADVKGMIEGAQLQGNIRQFCLDMILMGASHNADEKERKAIKTWAWVAGASILWDIQQESPAFIRYGNDTNNKLKRLGGPGEIAKGTFAAN